MNRSACSRCRPAAGAERQATTWREREKRRAAFNCLGSRTGISDGGKAPRWRTGAWTKFSSDFLVETARAHRAAGELACPARERGDPPDFRRRSRAFRLVPPLGRHLRAFSASCVSPVTHAAEPPDRPAARFGAPASAEAVTLQVLATVDRAGTARRDRETAGVEPAGDDSRPDRERSSQKCSEGMCRRRRNAGDAAAPQPPSPARPPHHRPGMGPLSAAAQNRARSPTPGARAVRAGTIRHRRRLSPSDPDVARFRAGALTRSRLTSGHAARLDT